jgi:hypothetical protein
MTLRPPSADSVASRRRLERFRPPAEELQALVPRRPRAGDGSRGQPPFAITSGHVARRGFLRNEAEGLAGWRFDIPPPDRGMPVLWASIWFDWQFYEWSSNLLYNNLDHNVHMNGSLIWIWLLTGHPEVFPNAPTFLTAGAQFTFETFVPPGESGWDVGWLAEPRIGTYSSVPDKIDDSGSSPLSRLLAMEHNGALMLWFAMDFRNPQVSEPGLQGSHGWTINGGADTLYYTYAYGSPRTAASGLATEPLMVG